MIFDRNYDKSLLLMIYGDMLNREKIFLVIKHISFELLGQIRLLINEYNNGNIDKVINYEKDSIRYQISMNEYELSIKMIRDNNDILEEIELYILPFDKELINKMGYETSFSLGGFICTNYFNGINCGATLDEYDLVKIKEGTYIKLYTDNSIESISKKKVKITNMPNYVSIMDIKNEKKVKKLIKKMQ